MAWMERGCPDWRRRARAFGAGTGRLRLLGVLGIANGAAVVFLFVLATLTILPLIELVLPSRTAADSAKTQSRWRSLLVPVGALIIM